MWARHEETFSGLHSDFRSAIRLGETDRGDAVSDIPGLKEVLGVLCHKLSRWRVLHER